MTDVVLDASAILAQLLGEPGAELVTPLLAGARVSAVNLAEVAAKLAERGASDEVIREVIGELPCRVDAFDAGAALRTGLLRRATRSVGLSLADRACLDLAEQTGATAYTSDRAWAELDLGVEVVLIRG